MKNMQIVKAIPNNGQCSHHAAQKDLIEMLTLLRNLKLACMLMVA